MASRKHVSHCHDAIVHMAAQTCQHFHMDMIRRRPHKVKEPSSRVSPVFVAFQKGQFEVRGHAARTHALVRPA